MVGGMQTGKLYRYVTSHPGQLSLAIHPWVGTMNTSESWGVNSTPSAEFRPLEAPTLMGGSTLGQGALPRFTCCPQIHKLAGKM